MLLGRAPRLSILLLPLLLATPAAADAPAASRAYFPDRRWDAVTAADAGLAGAGLATDPTSSFYANPALALEGPKALRASGLLLQPNRDDLRASTTDYQDGSGFPALGEVGARLRFRGLGVTAYFAQPHYEHQETRFVGIDPQTGAVTGDYFARRNEFTSATRYGGVGVALRLSSGLLLGVGAEAAMLVERYRSTPQVPPGVAADSFDVDRTSTAIGGSLGAAYTMGGLVTLGASYHRAGGASYEEGGTDDAPALALVGVRVGRTAGSSLYAGARFLGKREVDLADGSSAPATAGARSEFALGYGYLDPGGVWNFRIGGGLSPRPDDSALKLTRFGVALGAGTEGIHVSVGYARTNENRAGGRPSSRNLLVATVDLAP